jgi:CheY-like chemotaxis protein
MTELFSKLSNIDQTLISKYSIVVRHSGSPVEHIHPSSRPIPARKADTVHADQLYRILLVDDEPNILQSMAMVLKSDGYEVSTARHGTEALKQLEVSIPNLVISDLNMPEMSGFELLTIVRERFPAVPVIAISGVYDAGGHSPDGVVADAFYAKGRHRPDTLLRLVAELIRDSTAGSFLHPRSSFLM